MSSCESSVYTAIFVFLRRISLLGLDSDNLSVTKIFSLTGLGLDVQKLYSKDPQPVLPTNISHSQVEVPADCRYDLQSNVVSGSTEVEKPTADLEIQSSYLDPQQLLFEQLLSLNIGIEEDAARALAESSNGLKDALSFYYRVKHGVGYEDEADDHGYIDIEEESPPKSAHPYSPEMNVSVSMDPALISETLAPPYEHLPRYPSSVSSLTMEEDEREHLPPKMSADAFSPMSLGSPFGGVLSSPNPPEIRLSSHTVELNEDSMSLRPFEMLDEEDVVEEEEEGELEGRAGFVNEQVADGIAAAEVVSSVEKKYRSLLQEGYTEQDIVLAIEVGGHNTVDGIRNWIKEQEEHRLATSRRMSVRSTRGKGAFSFDAVASVSEEIAAPRAATPSVSGAVETRGAEGEDGIAAPSPGIEPSRSRTPSESAGSSSSRAGPAPVPVPKYKQHAPPPLLTIPKPTAATAHKANSPRSPVVSVHVTPVAIMIPSPTVIQIDEDEGDEPLVAVMTSSEPTPVTAVHVHLAPQTTPITGIARANPPPASGPLDIHPTTAPAPTRPRFHDTASARGLTAKYITKKKK